MADNETVDSAATEQETTGEETTTSAETENTETEAPGPVPYDRFKTVTHENRDLKEERDTLASERDELQRKVDELMSKTAKPSEVETATGDEELPDAPAGLSQRATVQWYVENDAAKFFEKRFGMSLDDAAALLKSIPSTATYTQEQQWKSLCEQHGLDPTDKDVRELAAGLLHVHGENADPNKVMERVSGILRKGKPKGETKPPGPTKAESDGVTGNMTVEDFIPRDKAEAVKAAQQGKRVPFISTSEILRRKHQKRA